MVVIKTARDRDQYVIWGTVVDDVIAGPGTRAQAEHYLLNSDRTRWTPDEAEEILARVDEHGSSDRCVQFAWWTDETITVGNGWTLPRDMLPAYADAIGADDKAAVAAMLTPPEDDD